MKAEKIREESAYTLPEQKAKEVLEKIGFKVFRRRKVSKKGTLFLVSRGSITLRLKELNDPKEVFETFLFEHNSQLLSGPKHGW